VGIEDKGPLATNHTTTKIEAMVVVMVVVVIVVVLEEEVVVEVSVVEEVLPLVEQGDVSVKLVG